MITFRYHVVTLIAVFLALGLGVLFGVSFLEQGTLKLLQGAQNNLSNRNASLLKQVRDLERQNKAFDTFGNQTRSRLVKDTLNGKSVVIVYFDSTPGDVVDGVAATLNEAGAGVEGSIQLSSKLDMSNEPRRQQVALALDSSETDPTALSNDLIAKLTASLSGRSVGFVQRLIDTDLANSGQAQGKDSKPPSSLASSGSIIVLISPGEKGSPKELNERVSVPLMQSLSVAGVISAAMEPGDKDLVLLPALRGDKDLRVVTVDGIEDPTGQVALALGLQSAIQGKFGHYGSGQGATAALPEP